MRIFKLIITLKMKKKSVTLKIDEWGQVINCYDSAMYVRDKLLTGETMAIPLSLGNMTKFHISFVDLSSATHYLTPYDDGSSGGLQMNIDRKGSYAIPWNNTIGEGGYISEKWNIHRGDADAILPFINTVLTGKNHYETKT